MKMLRNLLRDLISIQKRLLYRSCILPIALYSFQLWYYNKVPLSYFFKELRKMQRKVILKILGAFCTSPTLGIETIAGLIPIHLYLQKLNSRFYLRAHSLPSNHKIKSLLEMRSSNDKEAHQLLLERLILK